MNASLDKKLKAVKWGKFRAEQFFTLQKVTNMLSKEDLSDDYDFPAYSSESANNGIIGYTDSPEFICDQEHPVYVIFGDHTRTFNIARKSFSVLDNVKVLRPCVSNVFVLLWMITAWQKKIPSLGYMRHWKVAKNCTLELPVKNGKVDFDFMESFIAELEAERIAELSAYLKVSGLDNYELSADEKAALAALQDGRFTFAGLRFDRAFTHIRQGRRLKKEDQRQGDIPFVMSGTTNTGVVGYISNPVARFPSNSITVDIFGNTFYRSYAFGAGDDTGVYWNETIAYSKKVMLFFAASIGKALRGRFSYGNKLRSSQSTAFEMQVIVRNGKPDYAAMELLISAIQKLAIKDVVLYTDKKLAKTKEVIQNQRIETV